MKRRATFVAGMIALACLPGMANAAVCLARAFKNSKGIETKTTFIVPTVEVAGLSSLNLLPATCDTSAPKLVEYRDNVCKTAAFGNDAVQARFTQVLGIPPKMLCSYAKSLVAGTAK